MMRRLAVLVTEWPRAVVAAALVLAALGAWLGAFQLRIDSDTDSLIAPERPFMADYRAFLAEFGDLEGAIIAIDPKGDDAAARAAVDAIAAQLDLGDEKPLIGRWAATISPEEQWRLASWAASDAELRALAAEAEAIAAVARGDTRGHPLVTAALSAARPTEYLRAPGGTLFFVEAIPLKDFAALDPFRPSLDFVRSVVERVAKEHPTVEIGLTGKPVLMDDEMRTANADMARASLVSVAIITVLFILVFRGVRRPLLALVAFAVATGWTFGAATLLVGHLNLLSTVFMLVLVGAGLDYGVHVVSRYGEHRRTRPAAEAVALAVRHIGPGTLAGAAGSAAVFFGAIFTDFGGLRELGVIAGTGLLLCAVAMVTVLPALLVLLDRKDSKATTAAQPTRTRKPWPRGLALGLSLLPIVACLPLIPAGLRLESNLLELQSPQLESVRWEKRIFADSASASWFAASQATSLDEVAALEARAKDHPEILRTESVLGVVPRETAERAALRAEVARAGADLRSTYPSVDAPAAVRAAWMICWGASMSIGDALPEAIAPRLVSPHGVYMVRYLPKEDAWEEEPLARFVDAVRAVDPRATGVPITQLESIRDMRQAFIDTSIWALFAVTVIAAISFRALLPALVATATVAGGVGATLALLPLVGSHLNLANFFAVPMLIGLGIDSAIHIIHRFRSDPTNTTPTIRAVAFTALTTAIGFGALVFADHRGMQSLGLAMGVGSLACMYVACVVLPLFLKSGQKSL
ncbi:MAG: hypothetical protein RLY21_2218 [Planctomycetota bacterium]